MKNRIIFVLGTILILLTTITISAQKRNFKRDRSPDRLEELKLNDNQKEKINALHFDLEEKKIELQSAMKKNRLEVRKLMEKENFSDGELMALTEKGANLRTELLKLRVSFWLDVNKILDVDQKEIWKKQFRGMDMLNERFSKREKREFHRGDRGSRHFDKRQERL